MSFKLNQNRQITRDEPTGSGGNLHNARKHFRVKVLSILLAVGLLSTELTAGPAELSAARIPVKERENATPPGNLPVETGQPHPTEGPQETAQPIQTEGPVETGQPHQTEGPQQTVQPVPTEGPQETGQPLPTEGPKETAQPLQTEGSKKTKKTRKTEKTDKKASRLKTVSGIRLARYSTNSVKVSWKKHKKAKYYRVYYHKKNGKAKLAGITKNTRYLVNKLKNETSYYFYVVASDSPKTSSGESKPSKEVSIKTRNYIHKTVFAGDSVCEGIGYGQAIPQMRMEGKKKVVAYRGLNTVTFHTKRIFNGKTGLQKLIAEKPYRVYMMLGINEIHYRKTGDMITEYKGMIERIKMESPDTDLVLCAVSPVTRAEKARHSGYWQIPVFNKKLKKLAKQTGAHYFDYTAFLKDSGGYLKAEYAEGDGYHWKGPAYTVFGKLVNEFEKKLDR